MNHDFWMDTEKIIGFVNFPCHLTFSHSHFIPMICSTPILVADFNFYKG